MTHLHLALFLCANSAELADKHGDFQRFFTDVFQEASPKEVLITWEFFDVRKGEYPTLSDMKSGKYSGIIISGSYASTYDTEDWIKTLIKFIQTTRRDTSVKLIGVCFGHQIIAVAGGGTCVVNPNGWDCGFTQGTLTSHGRQFFEEKEPPVLRLHQVHRDHVPEVPPGFVSLATSKHAPIHALASCDNRCLTVQGHPEFSYDFTRDLIAKLTADGDPTLPMSWNQKLDTDRQYSKQLDSVWLVGQFIKFLQGHLPLKIDNKG